MLDRIKALVKRQPVASIGASITALVVAGIGVVNAFQPGTITEAQQGEVVRFLGAMWVVLALIWPTVTPAAAPKLRAGTDVRLPDGTSGTVAPK